MKSIPLSQGKFALVDDDDFDKLNKYKWSFDNTGYAERSIRLDSGKKSIVHMHRQIMKTPKGMETDHINGNKLDNRKENLRICTHAENQRNKGLQPHNTSGHTGVIWHKTSRNWTARIIVNGTTISLGYYKDKEDAIKARNEAAIKYHGKFARIQE